jgi:hypothetical protein
VKSKDNIRSISLPGWKSSGYGELKAKPASIIKHETPTRQRVQTNSTSCLQINQDIVNIEFSKERT